MCVLGKLIGAIGVLQGALGMPVSRLVVPFFVMLGGGTVGLAANSCASAASRCSWCMEFSLAWRPSMSTGLANGGFRMDRLRRTSGRLQIAAGDAELLHHGVQGGPRHAQTSGRGADHAAGLAEDAQDVIPLHFFERGALPPAPARPARSSASGARRLGPRERITDRSMKFSSSRTLPGHGQLTRPAWFPPGSCRCCGPSLRRTFW